MLTTGDLMQFRNSIIANKDNASPEDLKTIDHIVDVLNILLQRSSRNDMPAQPARTKNGECLILEVDFERRELTNSYVV